jgi:hypothetical protein
VGIVASRERVGVCHIASAFPAFSSA